MGARVDEPAVVGAQDISNTALTTPSKIILSFISLP